MAQVQHDVISTRTRHLDLHYHHLRDLVKRYNLAVKWISTKDQVADALTKPMDRNVEVLELCALQAPILTK